MKLNHHICTSAPATHRCVEELRYIQKNANVDLGNAISLSELPYEERSFSFCHHVNRKDAAECVYYIPKHTLPMVVNNSSVPLLLFCFNLMDAENYN